MATSPFYLAFDSQENGKKGKKKKNNRITKNYTYNNKKSSIRIVGTSWRGANRLGSLQVHVTIKKKKKEKYSTFRYRFDLENICVFENFS